MVADTPAVAKVEAFIPTTERGAVLSAVQKQASRAQVAVRIELEQGVATGSRDGVAADSPEAEWPMLARPVPAPDLAQQALAQVWVRV